MTFSGAVGFKPGSHKYFSQSYTLVQMWPYQVKAIPWVFDFNFSGQRLPSFGLVIPVDQLKSVSIARGKWPLGMCIKHVFLFWCFDIWGFADPGETALLRTPIPSDSKGLTCKCDLHMQTNQSNAHIPQPSPLPSSYTHIPSNHQCPDSMLQASLESPLLLTHCHHHHPSRNQDKVIRREWWQHHVW